MELDRIESREFPDEDKLAKVRAENSFVPKGSSLEGILTLYFNQENGILLRTIPYRQPAVIDIGQPPINACIGIGSNERGEHIMIRLLRFKGTYPAQHVREVTDKEVGEGRYHMLGVDVAVPAYLRADEIIKGVVDHAKGVIVNGNHRSNGQDEALQKRMETMFNLYPGDQAKPQDEI